MRKTYITKMPDKAKKNFREQNSLHEPYCILSKVISDYQTPNLEICVSLSKNSGSDVCFAIVSQIDKNYFSFEGKFSIADYDFLLFEGKEVMFVVKQ